jgi:hypothetical protein
VNPALNNFKRRYPIALITCFQYRQGHIPHQICLPTFFDIALTSTPVYYFLFAFFLSPILFSLSASTHALFTFIFIFHSFTSSLMAVHTALRQHVFSSSLTFNLFEITMLTFSCKYTPKVKQLYHILVFLMYDSNKFYSYQMLVIFLLYARFCLKTLLRRCFGYSHTSAAPKHNTLLWRYKCLSS